MDSLDLFWILFQLSIVFKYTWIGLNLCICMAETAAVWYILRIVRTGEHVQQYLQQCLWLWDWWERC